ncbi:4Fe-4S dicluster domain-containing protein [bacterium]|nr:4Fe-4S dicluster domain-containing protein [bacterium]
MSEKDIYEGFMQWQKQSWYGLPESEYLLPLIRARYSPEDAEFLTGLPFRKTPIKELVELRTIDESALTAKLDEMAARGLVWKDRKNGNVRYGLNDVFFAIFRSSFWPGKEDELSRNIAPPANSYVLNGAMDGFAKAEHKALRTLPIRETILPNTTIKPYEDVVKLLDYFQYYTVSHCPCRHRKNLDGDYANSKKPMEVCLHFDALGHYIVENGLGREITREETEEILKKSADAGLVHGLSNWQDKPDTICNCDKDYCFMFESYYQLDHHKALDQSNFEVQTTSVTCKGCGLCVKRCPMEALVLVDYPTADADLNKKAKVPRLTPNVCIGCGVCVVKCPTKSLVLVEKSEKVDPPQNAFDWTARYWNDSRNGKELKKKKN